MIVHRDLNNFPKLKNSVLTIGSFDGVHQGHKKILDRIKDYSRQYNAPSVVITFHPHPREIIYPADKSLELITTLQEKIILFEKSGIDHLVIIPFTVEFSQQSPEEYIERFLLQNFNPYCIVVGYDHKFGLNRAGDIFLLKEYSKEKGFKVVQIEKQECDDISISSTKIRNSIKNNEIKVANKLLGHPFFFIGEVIHGRKIGKGLGFPTANLKIKDKKKILPPAGIYAVKVYHGKSLYNGMMYVGSRPTIDDGGSRSIEVHIFDFNQYIYGESLLIEIVDFIRDDEKFDNLDLLKERLKADKILAISSLSAYEESTKLRSGYRGAVALLNYNGMKHLARFLPGVLKNCPTDCKVYLIDNSSTDDSLKWIRKHHPSVEIIELLDNTGYAGGYNLGLQLINEPYLALVNTDVAFEEDWITPAFDYLDNNKDVGALQPKILSVKEPEKFEYAGACGGYMDVFSYPFCRGRVFTHVETDEGQYDEEMEVFWASGAAFVVRKDLFTKLEGFDAMFFAHMEEIDLSWRLKKSGYRVVCLPQLKVYHLGGGTLDYNNPRKTFLNFRNNLFAILKNESKRRLVWVLPSRLLLDIAASFHFLLQGKFKLSKMVWKAHIEVFRSLPQLTMTRRRFNKAVERTKFRKSRTRFGRYYYSIIWQFFIRNKKKFSDLNWKQHEATRY